MLVMKVLCFALFACAFNLLLGYTGLLVLRPCGVSRHAAYVTGHALKVWELPTLLGLLAGTGARRCWAG
jgi:branched-chain amino acid transport system permease protein